MFNRNRFGVSIKKSIFHFISLAKEKALQQSITTDEMNHLIKYLLTLQNAIMDEYHLARIDENKSIIHYLENFANKLDHLALVTNHIDDFKEISPSIDNLIEAAIPPRTFSQKAK